MHLDGVPVKSCCVIIFVYTTRTSLFLIRDPLSVFASLPEEKVEVVLCCMPRDRVQYMALCSTRFASCPTNSR